jgi:hypothetical protein
MKCIAPLAHAGYPLIAARPAVRFVDPRSRYPNLAPTANDRILINLGVTPDHVGVDDQALRDLANSSRSPVIVSTIFLRAPPDQTATRRLFHG